MRRMTPFAILLAALSAPALAGEYEDASDAVSAKFSSYIGKEDIAGFGDLFTQDAVFVPVGTPPVMGREGIERWASVAARQWRALSTERTHVSGSGDTALASGTWQGRLTGPDGGPVEASGSYLTVLRREGGTWRIRANAWNVAPPPAAGMVSTK